MLERKEFGFFNGYKVWLFTITNKNGASVTLTNFAGAVVNLLMPDKNGKLDDIVLGYDNIDGYIAGDSSHGALVGRYANRIANAQFELNGAVYKLFANENTNTLHGGMVGFNKRVWTIEDTSINSVTFGYVSPDGEENFPGTVKVTCKYTLTDDNELKLEYTGVSDKDTVLNLTNHTYFNLGGLDNDTVLDHELQLNADYYTPVNAALIPTGELADVTGTPFDFRTPKLIGKDVEAGLLRGYDHNYMLGEPHVMRKAAVAYHAATGREMTVYTDKPAIQLYTAIGLNGTDIGKGGRAMKFQTAFCLESQYAPDSPNQPNFPDCTLKAGEKYEYTTIYAFSVR